MFGQCPSFNQPLDEWDVGNVTQMDHVFYGATIFNQEIGNWDVSNALTIHALFSGAPFGFGQTFLDGMLERLQTLKNGVVTRTGPTDILICISVTLMFWINIYDNGRAKSMVEFYVQISPR